MSRYHAGLDEAGYGCLGGAMVAVALAAPVGWKPPPGLRDSKVLTHTKRMALREALYADERVRIGYALAHAPDIDKAGAGVTRWSLFRQAFARMREALPTGSTLTDAVIDGNVAIAGTRAVVKADATHPLVMAASVIAKLRHDEDLYDWHRRFPQYDLRSNQGYGTPKHLAVLAKCGAVPGLHRFSYGPVRAVKINENAGRKR